MKRLFGLITILLLSGISWAGNLTLVPKPQWTSLAGSGPLGKVTVEYESATPSSAAAALLLSVAQALPRHQLPYEGYLLKVGADGVFILAKDKNGELYARQTLDQLRQADGSYAYGTILDWPRQTWRGVHVLDSGPGSLPQLKSLIALLAKNRCNLLVYEIDYNYTFVTHPEIKADETGAWTKAQVGELVQAGRDNGIRVIPEINCLGHQSWHLPPGPLLAAHPDLEEPPDGTSPETSLSSDHFYCRSWCPSNPKVNKIMFDLFGELIDAFQTNLFHVGMDEVLVIASQDCPLCKGKDPAALFAKQVSDFHQYFTAHHVTMMMWDDRLLNSTVMGYGKYESSANGTEGALASVPTDVILCDWHYEGVQAYPSLSYLTGKGYRVWPTTYRDLTNAHRFMDAAEGLKSPLILGTLASVWLKGGHLWEALQPGYGTTQPDPGGDKQKGQTMLKTLQYMWNPAE